jgi:hypothetical protein
LLPRASLSVVVCGTAAAAAVASTSTGLSMRARCTHAPACP